MKTNRCDRKRGLSFQSLEQRLALDADGVQAVPDSNYAEIAELSKTEATSPEVASLELIGLEPTGMELKNLASSSVDLTAEIVLFDVEMTGFEFRGMSGGLPVDAQITTAEMEVQDLDTFMLLGADDSQSEISSDNEVTESNLFRTFSSGGSLTVLDVSGDGVVGDLDVELIIVSLNGQVEDASALEDRTVELSLDINQDGLVSALDALIVINWINHLPTSDEPPVSGTLLAEEQSNEDARHALRDEPVNGVAKVDLDAVLESLGDGAKELYLADVGPYGVVALKLSSDGRLSVEADSVLIEPVIGGDGSIAIGDLILPARVVKTDGGNIGLLSGYANVEELSPIDMVGDEGLTQTRLAGATIMTVTGVGDYGPIMLSFSDQGEVLAIGNGSFLKVATDEQDRLSINGIAIPVGVVTLADSRVFVPLESDVSSPFTVAWPTSVDDAFASWE